MKDGAPLSKRVVLSKVRLGARDHFQKLSILTRSFFFFFFFFLFLSGLFGSVSKKSSAPTTSGGATTINDGIQQALRGWY